MTCFLTVTALTDYCLDRDTSVFLALHQGLVDLVGLLHVVEGKHNETTHVDLL